MDSLGEDSSTSASTTEQRVTRSNTSNQARPRQRKQQKPRSYRQHQVKLLKEILTLQKSTQLLVPKAPISRLIREITYVHSTTVTRYTASALEALHEAAEMYVVQFLQDAYLLSLHRGRVTLSLQDMHLLQVLKPLF